MAVTAAQAIANHTANPAISPQTVADTAANLLAALSGLTALQLASGIASVQLTGTANVTTIAEARSLTLLRNFTITAPATLTIADSATNLINPANASLLTLATTVLLTGANAVTVAQATKLAAIAHLSLASGATLQVSGNAATLLANTASLGLATTVLLFGTANAGPVSLAVSLAALPGFALATGAKLAISDSVAALLNPANAAALTNATQITLTGTGPGSAVTAAQATALVALHGFKPNGGTTLLISDNAANLLNAANINAAGRALGVTLIGDNTVTAAQAKALARLHKFALASGATLTVADSANALLLPGSAAGVAAATTVTITGANVVNAARATRLAGFHGISFAPGATLEVRDNAVNLIDLANAAGFALGTSVVITGGKYVSAAQADLFATLTHWSLAPGVPFLVSDTLANLLDSANATGLALATAVRLTGDATTTAAVATKLTALHGFHVGTQVIGTLTVIDNAANLLLPANAAGIAVATAVKLDGSVVLSVAGATQLGALPAFALTTGTTLGISDSAAAVVAVIDALEAMAAKNLITGIALTDGGTPLLSLTNTQYANDAAVLALITGPHAVAVVGAAGETLTALTSGITLDGSAGTQVLNAAAAGGDTLIGGAGDTLNGGAGNDTFAFGAAFGSETVNGFAAASDVLQFSTTAFADWAHLLGASAQVGSDVVITLDATDTITLKNVTLASLSSTNARFV